MNMNKTKIAMLIGTLLLSGCASTPEVRLTATSGEQQELVTSLATLEQQRRLAPTDITLKKQEQVTRTRLVNLYLKQADKAIAEHDFQQAEQAWRTVLRYQPGNMRAQQGLRHSHSRYSVDALYQDAVKLAEENPELALKKIQEVLEESPDWPQATILRDRLLRQLAASQSPDISLDKELQKPISLNFPSHNLMQIFTTISHMTGVNFIFDNDVPRDMNASIIARDTTAEDAINLLLVSHELRKKVLNSNTLLIYPANQAKDKTYREIAVKTFFLSYAKAKEINVALRSLLKFKDIHVDERTNTLTIRAPQDMLDTAERLLMTLDRPEAEVTLDVEVLEVNTSDVENLGINYPGSVGVGFATSEENGNNIPLTDFSKNNLFVNLGDKKGVSVDISKIRSHARILANPRIRVKNNKKAQIEIGEKIPVITNTFNDNFSSEKVEYQDVGLKLEVTPDISLEGDIGMDVNFTLSSLGLAQTGSNGLKYYGTNNRTAKTVLSSQDGETQMLAGLINEENKDNSNGIPWLSDIPLIGRLFGSSGQDVKRTEVILLITPHIERSIDLPGSHVSTIPIGTENLPGEQNTILHSAGHINVGDDNDTAVPALTPPPHEPEEHAMLPPDGTEQTQ
ncbi:secretin N-terminal domain-containing protein [Enterobacter sp. 22466]|uniref:secretin N-terminal domain-containing protein n=1 Tax=Enterobacter sp. 22466 TaxID=3453924 RepID=UPI003F82AB24